MTKPLGLLAASFALQSGALDPEAYLEESFDRANEVEPWLKAFVSRQSMEQLLASLGGAGVGGLLTGIPVGIKDLIATAALPTTNGSPIYVDQITTRDAAIVDKIRALGGAVFGKTVTTEFAWREPGPTVNPHHPDHTPGGSSSGSAAAVAAGIVPLALGTQTVGSVIRPAAYCGIVGFKASYGAVPRDDVFPLSGSLDHVGFLTRSVDDAAFAFELLRNRTANEADSIVVPSVSVDLKNGLSVMSPPRLALLSTPYDDRVTPEQAQAMGLAVEKIRAAGGTVEQLNLPDEYWQGIDALFCLLECEGGSIHEQHVQKYFDRTSEHIRELVANGTKRAAFEYLKARTLQKYLRENAAVQMQTYDAVLTVPATGEAPLGLSYTGDPIFCALWSFTGLPALTMPINKSKKGLPLGLQLVAPYRQDAHLLRTGKWVEGALALTF
jgi:Asp-tRNA(Asn)/Glu-tRNA(Gln) amidotransferase A subunit family amidase